MIRIATVRQRGQLTIPDEIRSQLLWINAHKAVRIRMESTKRIVIEPYREEKQTDWKKLRAQLARVATYKGKRGNLSQFIARDRYHH